MTQPAASPDVKPPESPTTDAKLVKPQSKTKIRLLRDADINGETRREGTVVEVDEERAKELCDRVFTGPPQFRGEREENDPSTKPSKITRAVRV